MPKARKGRAVALTPEESAALRFNLFNEPDVQPPRFNNNNRSVRDHKVYVGDPYRRRSDAEREDTIHRIRDTVNGLVLLLPQNPEVVDDVQGVVELGLNYLMEATSTDAVNDISADVVASLIRILTGIKDVRPGIYDPSVEHDLGRLIDMWRFMSSRIHR